MGYFSDPQSRAVDLDFPKTSLDQLLFSVTLTFRVITPRKAGAP